MKIHFLGAAQTVTGSCYIIEAADRRFAIDCGMHQGNTEIEKRNWDMGPYAPERLDFVLITHAHIDHTGLLPRLVSHGFKGPVYCTPPTKDLMDIMLLDSAHIQEMEAEWRTKKRQRHGQKADRPLYTTADAQKATALLRPTPYNERFEPAPGIKANFRDAGHILGSACIELWVKVNGDKTKLVFSGDLGRPDPLLVREPSVVGSADYLVMESTYGDRDHKDESRSLGELAEAIAWSYEHKEKVIIPAFAVERSQQIIYSLYVLAKEGKLPKDMPVYLDSPLAIRATEVFRKRPDYFEPETRAIFAAGEDPFNLPNLRFTESSEESRAINSTKGPAVVISASGMANAGRIKHHLRHNLWRPGASVVFVGYQGVGTPGRKIVDGAKEITLLGERVAVEAKIFTIGGFSAHAGLSEIMEWLEHFHTPQMQVILTHGEPGAQEHLAGLIKEKLGLSVHVAAYLEELTLAPGRKMQPVLPPAAALPRIDWDFLLRDSDGLFAEFRKRLETVRHKPFVEQAEIRDRLMEINRDMVEIISEL